MEVSCERGEPGTVGMGGTGGIVGRTVGNVGGSSPFNGGGSGAVAGDGAVADLATDESWLEPATAWSVSSICVSRSVLDSNCNSGAASASFSASSLIAGASARGSGVCCCC